MKSGKIIALALLALSHLFSFAQEPENDQENRITALEEQTETLDKVVKGLSKFKVSAYLQAQYQNGEEDATLEVGDKNENADKGFNRTLDLFR